MRLFGDAARAADAHDRLDRRLGRARPAEPRQGHPFRYARWRLLNRSIEAPLTAADLPDAEALVREAGWNQVAADWEIFRALGTVFAAREDGRVIATAATLPYGDIRLDQHGAGRCRASPARARHAAAEALHRGAR